MDIINSIISKYVRRVGSGYKVFSHKGKVLSRSYPSAKQARIRLHQIEYFKNLNKSDIKFHDVEGIYREGERPPEGLQRGDYFTDSAHRRWGVVGQGDKVRVVAAWKVPEYRGEDFKPRQIPKREEGFWDAPKAPVKTEQVKHDVFEIYNDEGNRFRFVLKPGEIGPKVPKGYKVRHLRSVTIDKPILPNKGKQPKKRIKLSREERIARFEQRAVDMPSNVKHEITEEMLRRQANKERNIGRYNRWAGSLPIKYRTPARIAGGVGLGLLGAWALRHRHNKMRQNGSESTRNWSKLHKSIGGLGGRPFHIPKNIVIRSAKPIKYVAESNPLRFRMMNYLGDTKHPRVTLIGHRLFAQNIIQGQLIRKPVTQDQAKLWWTRKVPWYDVQSNMEKKDIGFINDNGFYETYDTKGNMIYVLPEFINEFIKNKMGLETAAVKSLCKVLYSNLAKG